MHILHDGLTVQVTFHIISPECIELMRAEGKTIVEFESDEPLSIHEVHLSHDENGAVVASRKKRMGVACSVASARVGDEVAFSPVPPGAAIRLDGAGIGTMDESGVAEIRVTVAGTHRFGFSLAGYVDEELTLEVDRAA
jgi:hypothetical protein